MVDWGVVCVYTGYPEYVKLGKFYKVNTNFNFTYEDGNSGHTKFKTFEQLEEYWRGRGGDHKFKKVKLNPRRI